MGVMNKRLLVHQVLAGHRGCSTIDDTPLTVYHFEGNETNVRRPQLREGPKSYGPGREEPTNKWPLVNLTGELIGIFCWPLGSYFKSREYDGCLERGNERGYSA